MFPVHRNERPFVCNLCGHAFSQKNNLNIHLRIHSGERPYQCHLCGKTFRTQGSSCPLDKRADKKKELFLRGVFHSLYSSLPKTASLDKHSRTHTGERPFACDVCEQRFTEKGALVRHKASKHEEGRPHCCHICNKTFKGTECQHVARRSAAAVRHDSSCSPCAHSQGAASRSSASTQRHEEVSVSRLRLQIHQTGKRSPVSVFKLRLHVLLEI